MLCPHDWSAHHTPDAEFGLESHLVKRAQESRIPLQTEGTVQMDKNGEYPTVGNVLSTLRHEGTALPHYDNLTNHLKSHDPSTMQSGSKRT